MFSGLVKKSFDTVNENSTITLFLVLFLIVANFLLPYIFSAKSIISSSVLAVCLFLFTAVFAAGWINILKESIDKEKLKDKNFSAIFLEGVGKNTVSMIISFLGYTFFLVFVLFLTGKFAQHIFGGLDFLFRDIFNLATEQNAFMEYIKTLSTDKLFIIYGWQLSFMLAITIYNFIFLFMAPAIADDDKTNVFLRPFVAFKNSICFIFKKFFHVLGLYFLICLCTSFLNILRAMMSFNIVFAIVFLFINIYFVSYVIMIIFNYYEQNNCHNRTDCIGKDKSCDKPCENN